MSSPLFPVGSYHEPLPLELTKSPQVSPALDKLLRDVGRVALSPIDQNSLMFPFEDELPELMLPPVVVLPKERDVVRIHTATKRFAEPEPQENRENIPPPVRIFGFMVENKKQKT